MHWFQGERTGQDCVGTVLARREEKGQSVGGDDSRKAKGAHRDGLKQRGAHCQGSKEHVWMWMCGRAYSEGCVVELQLLQCLPQRWELVSLNREEPTEHHRDRLLQSQRDAGASHS